MVIAKKNMSKLWIIVFSVADFIGSNEVIHWGRKEGAKTGTKRKKKKVTFKKRGRKAERI